MNTELTVSARSLARMRRPHKIAGTHLLESTPAMSPEPLSSPLHPTSNNDQSRVLGRLILFGGPYVERSGERLLLSPLQGGLLALVATHGGRGIARSTLLTHLWDRGPEGVLRRRLSQAIYSMSGKLGIARILRSRGDALFLNHEAIDLDLNDFLIAVRDRSPSEALPFILRGFLPRSDPPHSRALEAWISERRVRYRAELRSLAVERWSEGENRADWMMAEEAARTMVALDPSDEKAVRRLAMALTLLQRSPEAEAVLRAHAERKHGPRNIEMAEQTVSESVQQVREASRLFARGTGERGPQAAAVSLVGRDREVASLREALRPRVTPQGIRVVSVEGRAGLGKTRLIEEVAPLLPFDGARTLSGKCGELQQNLPLTPLLEAIDVDWIRTAASQMEDPWAAVFAELLHRARPAEPVIAPLRLPQLGDMSRRLMEAFRTLFVETLSSDPVVLFIDDYHWIDETSVVVLDYLRRRWGDGELSLCLSYRPEELHANRAALAFLSSVDRDGSLFKIMLSELSFGEALDLVIHRGGGGIESEAAKSIVRGVGGVPFFLLEAVSNWGQHPVRSTSRRRLSLRFAPSLAESLESRIRRLSKEAQSALEVVAVSGREVGSALGSDVARLSPDTWIAALDELERVDAVRWSTRGVEIRHDLLRDFVVTRVGEARWREINHRFVVSGGDQLSAGELSFHCLHAGLRAEAVTFSVKAGEESTVSGAYAEALLFFERAWELEIDPSQRATLLAKLGEAAFRFQRLRVARDWLTQAIRALIEVQKEERVPSCRLCLFQCEFATGTISAPQAISLVRGLKLLCSRGESHELEARCFEAEAHLLVQSQSPGALRQLLAEVEERLPHIEDLAARVRLASLLSLHALYGDPARGVVYGGAAVELCEHSGESGDLYLLALSRRLISMINLGEADSPEGLRVRRVLQALLSRSGDLLLRCYPRINEASWNLDMGHYDQAIDSLRSVVEVLGSTDAVEVMVRAQTNLGTALVRAGKTSEALEVFTDAERRAGGRASEEIRLLIWCGIELSLLRLGRLSEAKERGSVAPPDPSEWSVDPTLFAEFLLEDARTRGNSSDALRRVWEISESIRERFKVHWIDLVEMAARVQNRVDPHSQRSDLIQSATREAKRLGLSEKSRSLAALTPQG